MSPSNVKVKFTRRVLDYYYWSCVMDEAETWGLFTHSAKHLKYYKKYCSSMLSTYGGGELPELIQELGEVKFQWTYYVTMPREEAFRLQLKYGQYIDQVRT